eukprot:XP_002314861.3 LOB domain-containing protein 41 [Populus trichocarpa]
MSFGSSRRLMYSSSLVVVLVVFVLQIWVCSDCNCKAGAIRLLQENGMEKFKESSDITKDNYKSKEKHFRKYFNERANTSYGFNKTEKGFEENKRREQNPWFLAFNFTPKTPPPLETAAPPPSFHNTPTNPLPLYAPLPLFLTYLSLLPSPHKNPSSSSETLPVRMSCNGCRVLRKGCNDNCTIRPCLQWIKSTDSQANATLFLAKFYGRAGLINLIEAAPQRLRPAIFSSLLYEACGRIVNPVYGSVGMLWSGNWAQCQAAVDAVLKGLPIISIPSSDVPTPHLISSLNTYDIRHVSRDQNSPELNKVKSRTRCKRSIGTRPSSLAEPTGRLNQGELGFEPVRESWLGHLGNGDSRIKDEDSILAAENVEDSLWSRVEPDQVFKFNGQSDDSDLSLELTLALVSE